MVLYVLYSCQEKKIHLQNSAKDRLIAARRGTNQYTKEDPQNFAEAKGKETIEIAAQKAEPLIAARARERQESGINQYSPVANLPQAETGKTRDELAEMTGVSARNNLLTRGLDLHLVANLPQCLNRF